MFAIGNAIWDLLIKLAYSFLLVTPEELSSTAWSTVNTDLHNYMYASAATILNLMFYAGFCKQLSNFRQNMTLEICIELFFRVIGANLLLSKGTEIIEKLITAAYGMTNDILGITGYKSIEIRSGMSESQTLKTAIHETAHAMLHDPDIEMKNGVETSKEEKEVQAESVAYAVCQYYGIDTSDYSFGYIASWSDSKKLNELRQSMDVIRKTASDIIDGIDAVLNPQIRQDLQEEPMKQEAKKTYQNPVHHKKPHTPKL